MQTLILGLDAFDPEVFERLGNAGRLPNLARLAGKDGYRRLTVTNPPQSEVSWTSIATGLDPGGHGLFDFVHRDPATYELHLSLLPTRQDLLGTHFVPPYGATTLFDHVASQGFPATTLWWPATFPARRASPVQTLPGLGTPDLMGRWGIGTAFSSDPDGRIAGHKVPTLTLSRHSQGMYVGRLSGPVRKARKGPVPSFLDFRLEVVEPTAATLTIGQQAVSLRLGSWSPILEVPFHVGPLVTVRAVTRAILTETDPSLRLYFLPLQIHPLGSPWPYGNPSGFVRGLWRDCGPFLTVGWPQDTTALEEGCISDDQFLDLCRSIFRQRERLLEHHLDTFREGVVAAVFDGLDRIQHMFWHTRQDVVEAWYEDLDRMVGRIEGRLAQRSGGRARLLVLSDHGFQDFRYKVHLNRWLLEHGFLTLRDPEAAPTLKQVDWDRTQAYAVGLNSLYLNVEGRERNGCVPAEAKAGLLGKLRKELMEWRGPDSRAIAQHVWMAREVFSGPLTTYGPDLVLGYTAGYRASSETALGEWGDRPLEVNRDHWGADHCMNAEAVPGVLFSSHGLGGWPSPSFRDIPELAIGSGWEAKAHGGPAVSSGEDQEAVEERLRSLGYL